MPERRERDADAERREPLADPAGFGIEAGERDTGNSCRQRERDIDDGVAQAASGKPISHQSPDDERAKYEIDRRSRQRKAERELERVQYARGS